MSGYLSDDETSFLFAIIERGGLHDAYEGRRVRRIAMRFSTVEASTLDSARSTLIESVMDMARKAVSLRKASTHVHEDILGECYVALLEALDRYDGSRGSWQALAQTTIRASVQAAEADQSYGGSLSVDAVKDVYLREHRGPEAMHKLSEASADKAAALMFGVASYSNSTTDEGDQFEHEDIEADFEQASIAALLAEGAVTDLLSVLTDEQLLLVKIKYLGARVLTDQETAWALMCSRPTATRLNGRALHRLKVAASDRGLT